MGTARRRMRDEIVNSLARLLEQPEVFLLMATQPTQYAHPEALVETDWLEKHLNDEGIRIVESNEDILLYDTGHIPGAVHIDWRADLQDPVIRDYIQPDKFAELCSRSEEHTSELQSPYDLVCRLLLEKKKKKNNPVIDTEKKNIKKKQITRNNKK